MADTKEHHDDVVTGLPVQRNDQDQTLPPVYTYPTHPLSDVTPATNNGMVTGLPVQQYDHDQPLPSVYTYPSYPGEGVHPKDGESTHVNIYQPQPVSQLLAITTLQPQLELARSMLARSSLTVLWQIHHVTIWDCPSSAVYAAVCSLEYLPLMQAVSIPTKFVSHCQTSVWSDVMMNLIRQSDQLNLMRQINVYTFWKFTGCSDLLARLF